MRGYVARGAWGRIAAGLVLALLGAGVPAGAEVIPGQARVVPHGADLAPSGPPFRPVPGYLELTGRLIARPVQAGAWRARGLDPAEAQRQVDRARALLADDVLIAYPQVGEYVIALRPGQTEDGRAAELLRTGLFEYVTPDWRVFPAEVPNDPRFGDQWQHVNMRSVEAWDLEHGSPAIICAVCDTGVDLGHPDLAGALVAGYNAVSRLPQAEGGDVTDINGHGTFVAGCAAAIGNNARGVVGMGWNLSIMPIRVTNSEDGSAFLSSILDGARWAIENGARVASASYSGVASPSVQTTGRYIRSIGGLFCYAAGNSATDHSTWDHPDVVVVGASDPQDQRASWSSFGRGVDLFAPGVNVWATRRGGGYGPGSGTSFSTPMANGALALIWSVDPSFSPHTTERILYLTCDDLGAPGDDDVFGWGRINQAAAIALAVQASTTPLPPVAVDDQRELIGDAPVALDPLANDYDLNDDPISIVGFDPASSAGGSVALSPGTGPEGRDELIYTPPAGYAGSDTIGYTIGDGTGLEGSGTIRLEVFSLDQFRAPDDPPATLPGVWAHYYALSAPAALPDFDALQPYLTEIVSRVRFPATGGPFAGSGREEDVGALFEGFLAVPETAEYTLWTESDDGSRLWIGDQLVVDNDGLHGMREVSGTIRLQAGLHAVRVGFFERSGDAGLLVRIAGPGIVRQVVPASMWFRAPCPADLTHDDRIDVVDFILFTLAYALGDPLADINGDGAVGITDLFAFVVAFERGCP